MNAVTPDKLAPVAFDDICDFRRVMEELEISEPRVRAVPHIWRWKDIRDKLLSSEKHDMSRVHRRAFALCNPGLDGRPIIATTMFTSVSVYFPGDHAPVHRHTGSASRFAIEGTGGVTTVAGEKLVMKRGDLVITPNGEWHDHGNEGTEPIFWIDVLDVPLIEHVNALMTEWNYEEDGKPTKTQSIRKPQGYSQNMFSGASIVPMFGWEERKQRDFTPQYQYPAAEMRRTLELLRSEKGSAYGGIIVEYVDPTSGKSVVPTLSFRSQLLRPNENLLDERRTANIVYCALEGEGTTVINGERFDWLKNDIFVVPAWHWHHHENGSADSVLFSVTDQPAVEKLGVFRSQGRNAHGDIIDLVRWPSFG